MNLTEFSQQVHEDNIRKGFYDEHRDLMKLLILKGSPDQTRSYGQAFIDQRLALIMSEAGEAVECNRKNLRANLKGVVSSFEGEDFKQAFRVHVKDTLEDEIADIIIRCLDLSGFLKIDIQKHVDLKLRYNKMRAYKHGKTY